MGKKSVIWIIVIAIIVILGLGIFMIKPERKVVDPPEMDAPKQNEKIWEFSGPEYKPSKVYDDNNSEITLTSFANKPMAIAFFNSSEETSIEILKILAQYEERYSDSVNVIAIDVAKDTENAREILLDQGINLENIVFDLDSLAQNEYNVNQIPTLIFINKNGEIINKIESDINEDVIIANLDILAENY